MTHKITGFFTEMFQLNFSEQSMQELNKLDTRSQMEVVEAVSSLSQKQLEHPSDPIGRFQRGGKTFYRIRAGDFRIYFEQQDEVLLAHYILNRNTFADFAFRTKLPLSEDFVIEQEDTFWNYLESLRHREESND
jgi:mRNA interferase RelE/StbE